MIFGHDIDICWSIQRTVSRDPADMIQEHALMKVDEPCIFCMEIDLKYFLCYRDSRRETPKSVISFITWALVLHFLSRGRLGMGMGVLGMGMGVQYSRRY